MDKTVIMEYLKNFLINNPQYAPTDSFVLGNPKEIIVENTKIYHVWWFEKDAERSARGGYSYYIFPDGKVLIPIGGTAKPEAPEDVWLRWKDISSSENIGIL